MTGISKTFNGVKALDNVHLSLKKGSIHALMGENGAGKSTLIRVLTGAYPFESGRILVDGQDVVNTSPEMAQKNGISTVYQEVNLCPNLSVAENLFIGREPRKWGMIDWKTMNRNADKILEDLDIHLDVTIPLESYSVAIQQMVAIARAVGFQSKVLILDEPTSSLDEEEVQKLFGLMRQVQAKGVGIIFVTHFLEQVYEVCDTISVLRNGTMVGTYPVEELPRMQLIAKMMGKDLDDLEEIRSDVSFQIEKSGTPLLEAKQVSRLPVVKPYSLELHKKEVVGVAGLLGSGRSELVRLLYGADMADKESQIRFQGQEVKLKHPYDAMKCGLAFCPENRKAEGIFPDLTVRENLNIAFQTRQGIFKLIPKKDQERFTDEYISILHIKTQDRETLIRNLSGGNQQKVIIGRWLLTHPELLILDEPTRGIDVGTKVEIQKLIVKLAQEGMGVFFISSEIDEMVRTCSRMIIMRDGQKVGELTQREELNQEAVMKAIAGGEGEC
ncbi:MAG: sugar ABC transporter ATP-binding protein [Lachnospiraceae bacterium]|nr:sugar ABC transporter ATP-binding protein [Lachnospiraceae bacterium]